MNAFLTFADFEMAERFFRSEDAGTLAEHAELSRSITQPMVIISGLPDHLVDYVRAELAPRWSAKFVPSRRYVPVAV